MAYEHKEGSGSLFKNDKGTNPARPDYRGDIMLNGVLYEISGWIKPKANNPEERYLSLAGKPKVRGPNLANNPARAQPKPSSGFDDFQDCPF